MRNLSKEQLREIRDHFVNYDAEYVTFFVSVTNAGAAIRLEFSHLPIDIDPTSWNGYDVCLSIDDVALAILKYDL